MKKEFFERLSHLNEQQQRDVQSSCEGIRRDEVGMVVSVSPIPESPELLAVLIVSLPAAETDSFRAEGTRLHLAKEIAQNFSVATPVLMSRFASYACRPIRPEELAANKELAFEVEFLRNELQQTLGGDDGRISLTFQADMLNLRNLNQNLH